MPDEKNPITKRENVETGLDFAAVIAGVAPWVGGPISNVLSGISLGRKMKRVEEVLLGFADEIKDLDSNVSRDFVATEDFEELLEKTIIAASDERHEAKRRMFRSFLVDAVRSPSEPYDEQIRFVRILHELQIDHIRVLQACEIHPDSVRESFMSRSQTLQHRLQDILPDRQGELIAQLNDLRVTKLEGLNTMVTERGAADLRFAITPLGQRLLSYVVER